MIHPIVVVLKGLPSIERRVNVDEFDFASIFSTKGRRLIENPKRIETVTKKKKVV